MEYEKLQIVGRSGYGIFEGKGNGKLFRKLKEIAYQSPAWSGHVKCDSN